MKHSNFSTSALFDAITPYMPGACAPSYVYDIAYEVGEKVFFSRRNLIQENDLSSFEAVGIQKLRDRNGLGNVYLSSRTESVFHATLQDAIRLYKEGYTLYCIKESSPLASSFGALDLRLLRDNPIHSIHELTSGSFNENIISSRGLGDAYAFLACPKNISAPTNGQLLELSNWMVDIGYELESLCAIPGPLNSFGRTTFCVEVVDCSGPYFSQFSADISAQDFLDDVVHRHEPHLMY